MTLNPQPTYPSLGSYVLKLHRDAAPQQGLLRGRLEHIASGEGFDFADGEALIAGLVRHAAALRPAQPLPNPISPPLAQGDRHDIR